MRRNKKGHAIALALLVLLGIILVATYVPAVKATIVDVVHAWHGA